MNETHLQFLSSPDWARMLESELLPWVEAAGDLGDEELYRSLRHGGLFVGQESVDSEMIRVEAWGSLEQLLLNLGLLIVGAGALGCTRGFWLRRNRQAGAR